MFSFAKSKSIVGGWLWCNHELHPIGISKKGSCFAPYHPRTSFARWKAWHEIGGKLPPCIAYLMSVISTIRNNDGNGVDRTRFEWDLMTNMPVLFTESSAKMMVPSADFRRFVIECIEKKRLRRVKRERRASNKRSRYIHGSLTGCR